MRVLDFNEIEFVSGGSFEGPFNQHGYRILDASSSPVSPSNVASGDVLVIGERSSEGLEGWWNDLSSGQRAAILGVVLIAGAVPFALGAGAGGIAIGAGYMISAANCSLIAQMLGVAGAVVTTAGAFMP